MDKVRRWQHKMNSYYNRVSPSKLKNDLEKSGFRVLHVGNDYAHVRSVVSTSMSEVAATVEVNQDDDLFISLYEGNVVKK